MARICVSLSRASGEPHVPHPVLLETFYLFMVVYLFISKSCVMCSIYFSLLEKYDNFIYFFHFTVETSFSKCVVETEVLLSVSVVLPLTDLIAVFG